MNTNNNNKNQIAVRSLVGYPFHYSKPCFGFTYVIMRIQIQKQVLIVPDFTIYLYSSSGNYVFFSLILTSFLSLSIYRYPPKPNGKQRNGQTKKRRENKTKKWKLHEQKLLNPGLLASLLDLDPHYDLCASGKRKAPFGSASWSRG